jgi:ubiquinone/menaquinone biosynthesis C-methylase UbiE
MAERSSALGIAGTRSHQYSSYSSSTVRSAIRATFNAAAPHFDAEPLFFWDVVGRRTVELAGIAVGSRVLDVCCGTGASAIPAADRVGPSGTVVGVDLADQLLARGRSKANALGLRNVKFVAGAMEELDFPDGSIDAVLCILGLYYAQDQQSVIRRLWQLVKPGGLLAITVWGPRCLEPANTFYLDAVADERPDFDARSADQASRLGDSTLLRNILRRSCSAEPTIIEEVLAHAYTPAEFWDVVLGSGYRISLDAMEPAAAERVRLALQLRMESERVAEVVSDVLYAIVRKH